MLEPLTTYQVTNFCAKIQRMLGCTAFDKQNRCRVPTVMEKTKTKKKKNRSFKIVSSWPGFIFLRFKPA